jgi:Holliday junction resolvasome RuvABC ATP-dependent DNA helicase subunit
MFETLTFKHPRIREALAKRAAKGERGFPQLTIRMLKKCRDIVGQRRSAVKMKDFAVQQLQRRSCAKQG